MNFDTHIDANTLLALLQQLQWLRPLWFLALLPLALFVWYSWQGKRRQAQWQLVCDAALLPHLLTRTLARASRWPLLWLTLASVLSIVALAGPVFEKLPQPVFRDDAALVIALDLSQSMNANDLKPTRLQRAKLKLLDLLKTRKAGQTALIVYAANAFTVTPLTDDTATIANLVATLQTNLMPAQGSHADTALRLASDLLQQAGAAQGDILFITDGLRASDIEAIATRAEQNYRVSILGVGTALGGPIPLEGGFLQDASGAIVIPKLDSASLQRAALAGTGLYLNIQTGDGDIERLAQWFNVTAPREHSAKTELNADIWREVGPWILLPVIVLAAFGMRRGWLLSMCIALMLTQPTQPVYAADTAASDALLHKLKQFNSDNLWASPDQQAARKLEAGDASTAAKLFEQPAWKASAHYRAGEYAQAVAALENASSSDDFYNRGNALAQMKHYQDAIDAYDKALELDTHNEDARYNREQVKRALQQPQDQQDSSQDKSQDPSQDNEDPQDKDSQQQDSQQQDAQDQHAGQQASPQQQNQQQPSQQQQDQPKDSPQHKAEDTPQQADKSQQDQSQQLPQSDHDKDNLRHQVEQQNAQNEDPQTPDAQQQNQADYNDNAQAREDAQATEQWLRRIPDDPGGLLRNKFKYMNSRLPAPAQDTQPW